MSVIIMQISGYCRTQASRCHNRYCLLFLLVLLTLPGGAGAEPLYLVTAAFPPYAFMENGQQQGITVDLVREACARLREDCRIDFVPFSRGIEMLKTGKADGMFPYSRTPDRLDYAQYPATALVSDYSALFVRADSTITFDGDFSRLASFHFGVTRGTFQGEAFAQAAERYQLRIEDVSDQEQNIRKLLAGRIDIAVGRGVVIEYSAQQMRKTAEIRMLKPVINRGELFVAFSKQRDFQPLMNRLDQVLQAMRHDGTYERILARYRGTPPAR